MVAALAERGVAARPLGDVLYLLASPVAAPETCAAALDALVSALDHVPTRPAASAASVV